MTDYRRYEDYCDEGCGSTGTAVEIRCPNKSAGRFREPGDWEQRSYPKCAYHGNELRVRANQSPLENQKLVEADRIRIKKAVAKALEAKIKKLQAALKTLKASK